MGDQNKVQEDNGKFHVRCDEKLNSHEANENGVLTVEVGIPIKTDWDNPPELIGNGDFGELRFGSERMSPGWCFSDDVRNLHVCGGGDCPAWIGGKMDDNGLCAAGPSGIGDCAEPGHETVQVTAFKSICPVGAAWNAVTQEQAIAWVQFLSDRNEG